ncbi:MAG: PqqD family protein [Polyangiales bacterium]
MSDAEADVTLDETTAVRQSDRTASRVVEGQAVVIVIDRQKLHTLNEVGTTIWELADGRTLGEIADGIVEEFEVDRDTALADARKFVEQLARLGALELTRS